MIMITLTESKTEDIKMTTDINIKDNRKRCKSNLSDSDLYAEK